MVSAYLVNLVESHDILDSDVRVWYEIDNYTAM